VLTAAVPPLKKMRGTRVVAGASSSLNGVVAGGVFFLAATIGYLHVYLPHYSDAAAVAREREQAGAAVAAGGAAITRGSTWGAMTRARNAQ